MKKSNNNKAATKRKRPVQVDETDLPPPTLAGMLEWKKREMGSIPEKRRKLEREIINTRSELLVNTKETSGLEYWPRHNSLARKLQRLTQEHASLVGQEEKYRRRLEFLVEKEQSVVSKKQKTVNRQSAVHPALDVVRDEQQINPIERERRSDELLMVHYFSALCQVEFTYRNQCSHCRTSSLIMFTSESLLPCCLCGRVRPYFNMTNSAVAWGHSAAIQRHEYERMKFVYKRLFEYHVGAPPIPNTLLFKIKRRLMSYHMTSQASVSPKMIFNVVNELQCIQWRSYTRKIASIINETEIAQLTNEQMIEIVERIFIIQRGYFYVRSKVPRVNFPYFNFLVNYICHINGWIDVQSCFPVQKTQDVIFRHEDEWRQFYIPYLIRYDRKYKWLLPTDEIPEPLAF